MSLPLHFYEANWGDVETAILGVIYLLSPMWLPCFRAVCPFRVELRRKGHR